METKNKSLKVNAFLSTLKTLSNAIFPLITYPYISRVISVEGMGKISFSQSIVNYFLLIAGFGIYHFSVREGAGIRDDKENFNLFANRVFTINCIAALISFLMLMILLLLPTKIGEYKKLIFIYSISIILNPFSVEWLYTVYEDFGYITARSILVHLISLCLTFLFVKERGDVYLYCVFMVTAASLGSLFNYVHSKKYVVLKLVKETGWKDYKLSLFIFFVNSLATTIYINSDTTLLGLMCSDWNVGLYGAATKIYLVVKQIFNSVVAVTIPRLAYLRHRNPEEFLSLIRIMVSLAAFFIFPAALGITIIRNELILLIAGQEYIEAAIPLSILAVAIICAIYANIFVNGLLLCMGMEKYVLKITATSAFLNLFLNIFLIPIFQETGAAITTVIAEGVVVIMAVSYSKKELKGLFDSRAIVKSLIGCFIMYLVSILIKNALTEVNYVLRLIVIVCVCAFVYIVVEITAKNEIISKIKLLC